MVPNHKIWVPRGTISLRQDMGNDIKKIFITSDFHILP